MMAGVQAIICNLIVESIEACLPFWIDRLGFRETVRVPHEDRIGFVILVHGGVELMLQSRASLAADVAPVAEEPFRASLYIRVEDLAPIRSGLDGWPTVVPERTTFYGAREIIVIDPAGNVIAFAAHEAAV
jgi:uncharacterized glyoxalase superfamily protein PhnB